MTRGGLAALLTLCSGIVGLIARKKGPKPVSEPEEDTEAPQLPDGDEPSSTTPEQLRAAVADIATGEIGSGDREKYWASAAPNDPSMVSKDWCGAFALWALHEAGLATEWFWEPGLGFLMTKHHRLPTTRTPQIGDVAYFAKNQHEAIVAGVNLDAGTVDLINGNSIGGVVAPSTVPIGAVHAFFSIEPLLTDALS